MKWTTVHYTSIAAIGALTLLPACSGYNRSVSAADTNPILAKGKWEHVPAAVQAAVGPNEFAVVSEKYEASGKEAEFELIHMHGNKAKVFAHQRDNGIEFEASISSLKDTKDRDARRLLRDIRIRLGQLEEKGWAPLPAGWD